MTKTNIPDQISEKGSLINSGKRTDFKNIRTFEANA